MADSKEERIVVEPQEATPYHDEATQLRSSDDDARFDTARVHLYRDETVICETDTRGHATPGGRSPLEIVVHAGEGFIPLWAPDVTLRWRFQEQSMAVFVDPPAAKDYLRWLFGQALLLWDDAVPVRFTEAEDAWDFEIAMSPSNNCDSQGRCTLARAFFPDAGRHDLLIYPRMFDQVQQERIETMAHELGHVFGLRHFFAQISAEASVASEIFGTHTQFSIMNYGSNSFMTTQDRADLTLLYDLAHSGALTNINGTPIKLVQPFSASRLTPPDCVPISAAQAPVTAS